MKNERHTAGGGAHSPVAETARTPGEDPALRRTVVELVAIIDELVAAVERATTSGDLGWLRPLAVLCAEIECGVQHRARMDGVMIAEASQEVLNLLGGGSHREAEFAMRYLRVRERYPSVAALHERALAICRNLVVLILR